MSQNCNQNCSSCSEDCRERTVNTSDFIAKPHEMSSIKRLSALSAGKGESANPW